MVIVARMVRRVVDPWVAFFSLVLAAWALLFAASAEFALVAAGGVHAPSHAAHDGLVASIAMWCLMSVAMMAPTALPLLRTYRHMVESSGGGVPLRGFNALLAGYLTVWSLFSIGAGAAQHALAGAGLVSLAGVSGSAWLSAGLLALAGAYQFSALKHACLTRCRSPMAFLLSHWRAGPRGAIAMGLRHGVICVGCCWALMTLAFVGGTMNLAWMGGATVLMVIEKLPVGRKLTAPLGAVLIAAAAAVAAGSLVPR